MYSLTGEVNMCISRE